MNVTMTPMEPWEYQLNQAEFDRSVRRIGLIDHEVEFLHHRVDRLTERLSGMAGMLEYMAGKHEYLNPETYGETVRNEGSEGGERDSVGPESYQPEKRI